MTDYRRLRVPGGTYVFTLHLARAGGSRLTDRIDLLRAAYAATHLERPFETLAIVVLPDHLHAIWRLPPGDADFSTRWRLIKTRFSRALPPGPRRPSLLRKGEKGIWLRRFWEHRVRDAAELEACKRYVWSDPVRHGLVNRPEDWSHSSIHRDRDLAEGMMGQFNPSYETIRAFGDDEIDRSVRVAVGEAQPRKVRRAQPLAHPRLPQVGGQPRA
jgi:putative transposase